MKYIFIFFVYVYKILISPFIPHHCRFQPTCSNYMIDVLQKFGLIKGLSFGIKRIIKCNPWGGSGYDPVPQKREKK